MGNTVRHINVVLLSYFVPPMLGGIPAVLSCLITQFLECGLNVIVVAPIARPSAVEFSAVTWLNSPHIAASRQAMQRYKETQETDWNKILIEIEQAGSKIAEGLGPFAPSLVHSHTEHLLGEYIACYLGIPHIITMHGYFRERLCFEMEGVEYPAQLDWVRDQTSQQIRRTVTTAVSRFVKDKWVETGVPADWISVIYNPIRFDLFHPLSAQIRTRARQEFKILPQEKLLCFPQRSARFGFKTLLVAFEILRERRQDVRLLCADCGLDHQIETGSAILSRSFDLVKMPEVYAASDVVVLPNPYESFGLPAIESLACGIPLVACKSGAYGELLSDRETALLFKPQDPVHLADCVDEILNDPDLRNLLSKVPNEVLSHYRPGVIANQYRQLYEQVIMASDRYSS